MRYVKQASCVGGITDMGMKHELCCGEMMVCRKVS